MITFILAATTALVLQDDTPLRAAARDTAPRQALLSQGDVLEVRGERPGYLQVYDHRRERAGYVRTGAVRRYDDEPSQAPALLAVASFLRDLPGSESLGIAHVALYLKVAPPESIGVDAFDALGTMADRLARRASARYGRTEDRTPAQLEVASGYGLAFRSFDLGGRSVVCYDGEAFRRVLALEATPEQRLRAALGLTRPDCIDPQMNPIDRRALDEWRVAVLQKIDPAMLPTDLAGRLHVRRAAVWAALAWERERTREPDEAQEAGTQALKELALADRANLAEEDHAAYEEAAVRVGASRWAAEAVAPLPAESLHVEATPGQPGETCLQLKQAGKTLVERCTWAVPWLASARASKRQTALALAVQPTEGWRELWLFHRLEGDWTVDVLTPATEGPDVGYLEYAGWSPDETQVLAVRESRVKGAFRKSFELIGLASLAVEKRAESPRSLTPFYRWQAPDWKAQTVALR